MNYLNEKKPSVVVPKTPAQLPDKTIQKTPEEAVKQPVTEPVPAQDDISPPLEATLGGDDLVTPMEKI